MNDGLSNLPAERQQLVRLLVDQLSAVNGMAAIVLGGSYASGTYHAASDVDLALYYSPASPFAIADIRHIAEAVSVHATVTVTDFYGWGAWVNGGAWVHTAQGKVDFLYRNLEQVQGTIAEAQAGVWHHDYDQQPAHGFYSMIYLAETEICVPLFDPDHLIAGLKRSVAVYPPRLKEKVITDSLWAAEFTLLHARGFAAQGDVYNTAGCLTRAAANLTQALFALNERYFMRDKKVMDTIAAFPNLPPGYVQRTNRILGCPGGTAQELAQSVGDLERVWGDVVSLPGTHYAPKFRL